MSQPGADVPDHRGRTGLHLTGRELDRNPDVVVRDVELPCAGWHVLRKTTFDHRRADGTWSTQQRETYDRGDGAAVLPYDRDDAPGAGPSDVRGFFFNMAPVTFAKKCTSANPPTRQPANPPTLTSRG